MIALNKQWDLPVKPIVFAMVLTALFVLHGCAAGNYGRVMSSPEVTASFKAYEVLEGYTYYYYGQVNEPDAVLGLPQGVTIESKLWKQFDMSQNTFQVLIDRVGRGSTSRNGYHVMDNEGNRIGIYFGTGGNATVQMAGPNQIAWITPQMRRMERRSGFDD